MTLQRRTPLRRAVQPLARATKPLRRVSAKRLAGRGVYEAAKRAVWLRDSGECQAAAVWPEIACAGPVDPHHVWPQGLYPELRAVTENMRCVCRSHHDQIHQVDPIRAREAGLLR